MKLFPKSINDFKLVTTHQPEEKCAVIITGAISDINFLITSIKLYKIIFPDCMIIVSTWSSSKKNDIEKIQSENIEIILNDQPKVFAPLTLTYQMKNASEAIKIAEKNNCKFVLKTRTDWRIYKQNSMAFLLGLWKTFKIKNNDITKGRLIVTSMTTHKYRIYGLTDTIIFGHIMLNKFLR